MGDFADCGFTGLDMRKTPILASRRRFPGSVGSNWLRAPLNGGEVLPWIFLHTPYTTLAADKQRLPIDRDLQRVTVRAQTNIHHGTETLSLDGGVFGVWRELDVHSGPAFRSR